MQTELGGGVPERSTFADALEELKREGSNVLITGTGASRAQASACERLLGESSERDRYRLFVVTETNGCSCLGAKQRTRTRAGTENAATRIIGRTESVVDASAGDDAVVVGTDLLSNLATEIIETVNDFDEETGGLESSQLRICLDSLVPLLNGHDSENVFRLLHMTTSLVKRSSGMGHYHLPVARDHDATRLLEPLFDAVVEVRHQDGTEQQRWHLRDQRTSSEWIGI